MAEHSVEAHLGLKVADYDREIRRLVPHYDEMVAEGTALLSRLVAPDGHILDLGCGTGRMAAAIRGALPRASITLLDVDAKILDQARARFAAGEDAAKGLSFVRGSFFDALPSCDAIVASLSLHHVQELDAKTRVYRSAHDALPPGGLFLVLDASVSADPRLSALTFDGWADWMVARGIEARAARAHFEAWAREERYVPIAEELGALREAGFGAPECFWRKGPLAIYGALANR